MSKKLTFGDLEGGDQFIDFPTNGDNRGHGGYLGASHIFIKIEPCYAESSMNMFKSKTTKHPALKMNSLCIINGALSHFSDSMHVLELSK